VDVDELAPLFCRELLAATPGGASVLLARHMPTTDTVVRPEAPRDAAAAGALLPVEGLPMLDEIRLDGLSPLAATAARRVSHERDLWLPDHRPYQELRHPLFSAVMVAETFCEAARAVQPHLTPVGLDELRFLDILPCPAGRTRELRVHVSRRPPEGPETVLEALLESRDVSPKGRPLDRWSAHFRGRVLLAGRSAALKPWPDFPPDGAATAGPVSGSEMEAIYAAHTGQTGRYRVLAGIDGAGPGHVSGRMVHRLGEDVRGFTGAYQYSPYLLEALMQITLMHGLLVDPGGAGVLLPAGIGSVRFGRACRDGEEITLLARLRGEDADGRAWDALGLAGDGEILMQVRDLAMKRLQG
jgi:hypothetical protein